ncbi:MAG TPA: HAD-IA family hydrolase [Caldimonas sp.]|nr:HAD-IA family hydrolase [Caldimonas sp.]
MIRAVLFDAVGTLIHLREPVGETYARFARACGVDAPPAAIEAAFPRVLQAMPQMAFAGRPPAAVRVAEREWWRTVVRSVFDAAGVAPHVVDVDRCFDQLFAHFAGAAAWRCGDGVVDTLRTLRTRGIAVGMVSNFDHRLPALLDALGIAALFDAVVLPADAGAAKPDRRIFTCALARLGVPADEALYVGDDVADDAGGARRAGLGAVDVTALGDLRALLTHIA